MAKRFQSLNPSNARIYIDLDNKKNPVNFQYPHKSKPATIVLLTMLQVWLLLVILPLFIIGLPVGLGYLIWTIGTEPAHIDTMDLSGLMNHSGESCPANFTNYTSENITSIAPAISNSTSTSFHWENLTSDSMLLFFIALLIALSTVFFPPFLLTFIFLHSEKLMKKMPDINLFLSRVTGNGHYYVKVKKLDSRTYELPVFDNVFLDVSMTKDFKKQFKGMDVVEHNLWVKKVSLFGKKKKHKQDDAWFAKFYFRKIPKSGYLEVNFI